METSNYMVLGFIVIFGVLFLHLLSIHLRNRNINNELNILEQGSRKASRKTGARKKISRRARN